MSLSGVCLARMVESIHREQRRYPTIVIVEREQFPFTPALSSELLERCNLRCVNTNAELLENTPEAVQLGAYGRGDFLGWILAKARASHGILIERADWVIDTFRDADRRAFLLEFLHTECCHPEDSTKRIPIVLPTKHACHFVLPTKEIGQGYVADLAMMEG